MTSKQFLERFNETRRSPVICLTVEEAEEILKDLKVLDILQDNAVKYDNCVCIDSIFFEPEVMEWCK